MLSAGPRLGGGRARQPLPACGTDLTPARSARPSIQAAASSAWSGSRQDQPKERAVTPGTLYSARTTVERETTTRAPTMRKAFDDLFKFEGSPMPLLSEQDRQTVRGHLAVSSTASGSSSSRKPLARLRRRRRQAGAR